MQMLARYYNQNYIDKNLESPINKNLESMNYIKKQNDQRVIETNIANQNITETNTSDIIIEFNIDKKEEINMFKINKLF